MTDDFRRERFSRTVLLSGNVRNILTLPCLAVPILSDEVSNKIDAPRAIGSVRRLMIFILPAIVRLAPTVAE